jgi:hypothetical protein
MQVILTTICGYFVYLLDHFWHAQNIHALDLSYVRK